MLAPRRPSISRLLAAVFFHAALTGSLASSGSALAQQPQGKLARVGYVSVFPRAKVESFFVAFRDGLAALGYVEGRNLEIINRSAEGDPGRLDAIVKELLDLKPDVIVSQGGAIFRLREITEVPVVYGFSGDPVLAGIAKSLAHPGGNVTGVSFMAVELNEKRLDLLREAAPQVRRVLLMGDPVHPGFDLEVEASERMARQLGLEVHWTPTRNVQEVEATLNGLENAPPDAIVFLPDSVMSESRVQVAAFARRHRIPAISGWSMFAQSGGLLTYGPRLSESFRRVAEYTVRILRGAKPADLPVERPTTFELVINLNTARDIGLELPTSLLVQADELIE